MAVPYHALFHFLLYSPVLVRAPESNEARLVQRLLDALAEYDYRTDVAPTLTGAKVAAESDMAIGCFLLAIDGPNEDEVQALIHTIRNERGLDTPIYLVSELKGVESLSLAPLGEVTGYIYLDHETPAFSAKETIFALERYAASLKPPFFGALMDYDYEGNQMWTCPGHQGGAFYRRSPAGRLFVEHLGEAIFRNDIDNSVPELGDLLTHVGPALGRANGGGKGLRRRPHVLHPQRHLDVEQGRHRSAAQARRPRAVRSQQPQVQPSGRTATGRRDSRSISRPTATRRDSSARSTTTRSTRKNCASRSVPIRSSPTRRRGSASDRFVWRSSSNAATTARSTTPAA